MEVLSVCDNTADMMFSAKFSKDYDFMTFRIGGCASSPIDLSTPDTSAPNINLKYLLENSEHLLGKNPSWISFNVERDEEKEYVDLELIVKLGSNAKVQLSEEIHLNTAVEARFWKDYFHDDQATRGSSTSVSSDEPPCAPTIQLQISASSIVHSIDRCHGYFDIRVHTTCMFSRPGNFKWSVIIDQVREIDLVEER